MANIIVTAMIFIVSLMFTGICRYSHWSISSKLWGGVLFAYSSFCLQYPDATRAIKSNIHGYAAKSPLEAAIVTASILVLCKCVQREARFARIQSIKYKYGFIDNDSSTWEDMTVEMAQHIESNMAEWEFPRLFQFAWISDFLRTATNPGVSRAIVRSGHMVNADKTIEHERMQATIHLMTAIVAYPVGSAHHSLAIARINEHHHRYGIYINSDDVLYLITHFAFAPVPWINQFGWRKLEAFEEHAIWVLWREIACRMGVRYIPQTVEQAKAWRKKFELQCRWFDPANHTFGMAMLEQILYIVPSSLKPLARKVVVSVIDVDITKITQLQVLKPSFYLRRCVFALFRLCGWLIREFGLPRWGPYKRSPEEGMPGDVVNFGHTPYDTMPFYLEASGWNLWGPGALLRQLRGMPVPNTEFYCNGVTIESMGAKHRNVTVQAATEKKIRNEACKLEEAGYGYRPNIGYQANRLLDAEDGPEYGLDDNKFPENTKLIPNDARRFDKQWERRGQSWAGLRVVETCGDLYSKY